MKKKLHRSFQNGILAYISQFVIILFVILFTIETVPSFKPLKKIFIILNTLILYWFSTEYILRIFCAPNKKKYIFSFLGLIDLLSIAPFYLSFGTIDSRVIRMFQFLRFLRIFKNRHLNYATKRLISSFINIRYELIVFSILVFILIYISAFGIYLFEHPVQPETFSSIPACLWWAIISLTTVGYGDVVPITTGGKIFTSLMLYIGIGMIAIPTGLIASALTRTNKKKE